MTQAQHLGIEGGLRRTKGCSVCCNAVDKLWAEYRNHGRYGAAIAFAKERGL